MNRRAATTNLIITTCFLLIALPSGGIAGQVEQTFTVSFDRSVRTQPLTGRVYLAISGDEPSEGRRGGSGPIWQAGETGVPLFGRNVHDLRPDRPVAFDEEVYGYPLASFGEIPPGEYWIQAFFNVYTRFERADGHTVWLHMDQWEGQNWRRSPGNLYSEPRRITIGPGGEAVIHLTCDQVNPGRTLTLLP